MEFLSRMRKVYGAKEERAIERAIRRIEGASVESLLPQLAWGIRFGADGVRWLSVQGSNIHCCEPMATVPYGEYEKFEVALVEAGREVEASSFLSGVLVEELAEYERKSASGVIYAYVPKELVEKVYQWCKAKWGLTAD